MYRYIDNIISIHLHIHIGKKIHNIHTKYIYIYTHVYTVILYTDRQTDRQTYILRFYHNTTSKKKHLYVLILMEQHCTLTSASITQHSTLTSASITQHSTLTSALFLL